MSVTLSDAHPVVSEHVHTLHNIFCQVFKIKQVYRRQYESRRSSKPKLCIKNKKINKIWQKTIFNMTDEILTPCNVARSWHWFRQVTASCNVACGSAIMTVNSPSGSTLQCDTWLWDDMLLNSPLAAPCNVTGGSEMTCHGIRRNVRHIRILHLVSNLTISPQSTCHSAPVCKIFIQIGPPSAEKNVKSCRFSRWIPAVLDFRGPVMGSLKIPCTTSYRKSIETIAI